MANDFSPFVNTVAARFSDVTAYLQPHAAFLSAVTTADVTTSATNIQLTKIPTKSFKIGTYEASRLSDSPGLLDETFKIVEGWGFEVYSVIATRDSQAKQPPKMT